MSVSDLRLVKLEYNESEYVLCQEEDYQSIE